MSKNGGNKQVYEIVLGLAGQVRAVLEVTAEKRTLKIFAEGSLPQEFSVPVRLTAADLPIWMASAVRQAAVGVAESDLTQYEQMLRQALPPETSIISVVVGRRNELLSAQVFHFPRQKLVSDPVRGHPLVTVRARIEQQWTPLELRDWSFTFFTASLDAAHELQWKLLRTPETFFCLGGDTTGIVACNSERWETAGVPQAAVEALAAERKISLRLVCEEGDLRFAFRCK